MKPGRMRGAQEAQRGFSLVALMASVTIMLIMMGAAVPSWRYVMQNAREEELLFRGIQIAEAIERYQRKNGGAPPGSIEDLVKGRFLRKAYADPMTKSGKWRLVRPGEAPGMPFRRRFRRDNAARESLGMGGFVGVASTSEEKSYRIFNGQTQYDAWLFMAGQPRIIGRPRMIGGVPAEVGLPGAKPGAELPPGSPKPPGPGGAVDRDR